ncbi:MAG: SMC family ATPase [Chloroflexi bacterium]|nr:SMC family ATPase [Chloroflexota bacterium]
MIPISLRLQNFLCYRDNVPPLSFAGFHVVCLSGDNGNGKSALLDAITWALWGKARVDDRELIHVGRTDMEVEFEFALGADRYRVIRKRSFKFGGKNVRMQLVLDFQVCHDETFRSIAGNSADETQKKIVETLRMEYDTFVNSAFLRQGRADEFTAKAPAKRKEVLADILGLGYYDELAERAKARVKRCQAEAADLMASVREIDRELARKPEFEAQLKAVQHELKGIENAIAGVEVEVATAKARKSELDIKARQLADLEGRIRQVKQEIGELRCEIERLGQRIRGYEEVLVEKDDIERGYVRLNDARATVADLDERMSRLMALKDREGILARGIAEAKNALVADRRVILGDVESLQKRGAQAPALEKQLRSLQEQAHSLGDLDARRDERREFAQSCRSQIDFLKAMNAQLHQDMKDVKGKLDFVAKAGSSCPLCESDLGPSGRDRLAARFKEEGGRMGDVFRDNVKQIEQTERDVQAAQGEIARIEKSLQERQSLQRQIAMLEKGLADAREAEEQLGGARERLEQVSGRIERGEYAEAAQRELAEVRAQMLALGYDEERHRSVKGALASLQRYEALKLRLDDAGVRVGEERAALARTENGVTRWQAVLEGDAQQHEALAVELRQLPEVERRIADAERKLESLLSQQAEVRLRLGQAQQMLNHCGYLERERAERIAAQAKAAEAEAIYRDLLAAFGKNGVQAMIIESALPEIEDEANALLARMTDNRLHVTLETQKAQLDGGLKETLEIRIADELGIRSYDTYSGGEAFRINFALRVALSKLLARRAGARLQTLVVDEGFGTLDTAGRDSLVEAINSVSDDFEKIIVVTHIQELKDAFPARIDIVKDVEGSQIVVS